MRQSYDQRDDYQFGGRVMLSTVVVPVWIGLGLAFAFDCRPAGYIVSLACSLPIAFLIVYFRSRLAKCPQCGRSIRINWSSQEFCRGGMLRYICEDCCIEWATYLFPGSDV